LFTKTAIRPQRSIAAATIHPALAGIAMSATSVSISVCAAAAMSTLPA
jgi:hypothetical protein